MAENIHVVRNKMLVDLVAGVWKVGVLDTIKKGGLRVFHPICNKVSSNNSLTHKPLENYPNLWPKLG